MSKSVAIDFFKVECSDGKEFAEVLKEAKKVKRVKRTFGVLGKYLRLHELSKSSGVWRGETINIRMDAMPSKASLSGDLDAFELDPDEGVGEETAFEYHPDLNVLVLQRNRHGVTMTSFCRLFEHASRIEYVELQPILQKHAMKRFLAMQHIRSLEISIAGANNPSIVEDASLTDTKFIDAMRILDGPSVQLSVSMGYERSGSLSASGVFQFIKGLINRGTEGDVELRKLRVSGAKDQSDPLEVIDLIKDRIVEMAEITLDDDRRLPYEERRDALSQAWQNRKSEINSILGK
ncbi:hypothetical protein Mal52_28040 [Symmachiella dynata]|uniref:Uncharacterized protein n=1 Tax=Symmachiella dynata TaxID=2527995 RepID=A0A517ZPB9_9PLAN|nr:DUF6731 family protein [Symmachiella dynata]QDU44325.1 hypothetical protein Mal52_28040 [Symmachiella dynata]